MTNLEETFARKNATGNYDIFCEDGENVTRIDANVYPVGSSFSTRYEHPEGIELELKDVNKLGIEIEA